MALKGKLRSKRSKRFENVIDNSDSKSEDMLCSSTDSESDDSYSSKKVRNDFSIKRLMKTSENFKVDSDHIYSCGKMSCGVQQGKKRKISEASDEKPGRQKSVSKNAVMARINRERKKKYIKSLETENEDLRKKNDEIQKKIDAQNKTISNMKQEILYLKGLLANSKELGQILRNLRATTDLPITTSMFKSDEKVMNNVPSNEECMTEIKPRVKTVCSGYNFPILDKDVNLSSSSDKSFSLNDTIEDDYLGSYYHETSQDSIFNFNLSNVDLELSNLPKSYETFSCDYPPVGICLHVNNKRVSVEICSICNNKANFSGN